jgi:hypothetical protein
MSEMQVTTNPGDIVLSAHLYEEAFSRGMSLSQFLETSDPTHRYANDPVMGGLDAFERQLMLSGIRTRSDPSRGIYADKVEKFWASERAGAEILFPEYIARTWRGVSYGSQDTPPMNQQRFYASSAPISDVLAPAYINTLIHQKQIQPAIPLSSLIAITTPIDAGIYKAFYLTEDATERGMVRVGEGAEVPTARLTGGDHAIGVNKYGRRLLGTYEMFRRMRIDRFALHISLLAIQSEVDKVKTVIDVLINGDGNAGTAATNYNLTAIDTKATAGTPTVKGYLGWRMKWANPYNCGIVLGNEEHILELLTMNAGTANIMFGQLQGMFGIGGLTPLSNQLAGAQVGWDAQVSDNMWLGVDPRFAIEMVTEIGSTITETNRIISAQFNEIVMTESVGFAVFDQAATKTLTLNA